MDINCRKLVDQGISFSRLGGGHASFLATVVALGLGLFGCQDYKVLTSDAGHADSDGARGGKTGDGSVDRPFDSINVVLPDAASESSADTGDSRPGAANVTIDSTNHDFGTVVTQVPSADATFTVKNNGASPSADLTVGLSAGAVALGFSIKSDRCGGMSLGAGASCTIVVVLTPLSAGSPTSDLTVGAGPGVTLVAHLSAIVISPGALKMSPETQSFGMVIQSRGSASQTFTISNTNQQATAAATVVLGGTDRAEFQVTADGCTGQMLMAAGSCQITVRFAPTSLGAKSASLAVSAGPATAVAQLSGTGISPGTVTITPDTKDFGSVQQMVAGASQAFTITNAGQATTGSLASSLGGGDNANFKITVNTCDGHTLAANSTCSVTVQFSPIAAGSKLATLSVVGAPGESGVAQLSGTSLASPSITIAPATKDLGSVTVNQNASATFVVTNPGGVPTGVPSVTVAGATAADSGQFSIPAGSNGCTTAIAAGGSCMIAVHFTPTTTGVKSGTLTVSANPGASATTALTGTGIAPGKLSISPLNQDFGSQLQGTIGTTAVTFTVTNTGASPTGTLQTSIAGSTEFQIQQDKCSQTVLGALGTCMVSVIFAPTTATPSGRLQVIATSPADSASAGLTGVGLTQAKLAITPTSGQFTDTVVGQSNPSPLSFTVRNTGAVAAGSSTGLTPVIAGTNQADFSVVTGMSTCVGSLAAAAQCTVTVAFAPKTAGASKTASLTVNATPGGPTVVSLSGNGITAASVALAPAANNAVAFGNVVVGALKDQTFVVSNTGQQATTGLQIAFGNATGPGFALMSGAAGDCATNAALAGSATCNLRVRFAPASRGAQTASLAVSATVGGSPAGLALTGNAILAATLTANPAGVSLGNVTVGTGAPTSVMIINGGDVATSVPTVSNSNSAELTITGGCTAAIPMGGGACTLAMTFTPSAAGARSATVTVAVSGASVMFTVSATGVNPCGALGQPCCGGTGGTCNTTNLFCLGTTCAAKKANGVSCQTAIECTSNACVDGACCNGACALASTGAGQCMTCTTGTCAQRTGITTTACPTANPVSCVNLQTDVSNCGTCGRSCAVGQRCCGGGCAANGVSSCGSDCINCQQPNTASTSCVSGPTVPGTCQNTCSFGTVACSDNNSGKPTCNSWDLESATTEGWFLGPGTTAVATIGTSLTHNGGMRSLAVTATTNPPSQTAIAIRIHICNGTMALANMSITADIRIETASGMLVSGGGGFVETYNGAVLLQKTGDYTMQQFDPAIVGTGFGSAAGSLANGMTDVDFFFINPTTWSGTIFLDNIRIGP